MTKIKELKAGTNATIEGKVLSVGEEREVVSKFGKRLKVQDLMVGDGTGGVNVTAWNADVGKFSEGDRIRLTDGWVSTFKQELRVSPGKNGKMEKL